MEEEIGKFVGRWKLDRSENFDEFLKEMGVNVLLRKMAVSSKPEQEVKIEGDTMLVILITTFWNSVQNIKINGQYQHTESGVKMMCSSKWEDGKFVVSQHPIDPSSNIKKQIVHREMIDDELVTTLYVGDVMCKRIFKRR